MENTVKIILISLSVVAGLLFAAALCYSVSIVYISSVRPGTPEAAEAVSLQSAIDESNALPTNTLRPQATTDPSPASVPTETPNPAPAVKSDLTWNGLQIDISGINYEAWPLIEAQNSNNEPPLKGMTMLMITARVTNIDGKPEEPIQLDASDFQLIGDRNTPYETFQVSCGVVPDNLDGVVAPGDTMDGNICFQVFEDEGDFKLIYEPFGSPAVYFDLPQRGDTDWLPPEPPPVLVENENLTWNGLKIDIANINYNAWPLIKAENRNNDPPLQGMNMLLITIRATNIDGPPDEPIGLREHHFKLIGSRKTVYETFEVSCGVVPDEINSVVAPGNSTEGNLCFQVPKDEGAFQLIYEPFDSPAVYLNLPQRNPGK